MEANTKRAHSIPFPSQTTTATWYYCITLARFPFVADIVSVAAKTNPLLQNRWHEQHHTAQSYTVLGIPINE